MNGDWTTKDGRANTSGKYLEIVGEVERLIRNDAHKLIAGRADLTARLIVSQLAFKHGMRPSLVKLTREPSDSRCTLGEGHD